jgi:hypothetical protein
MEVEGAYAPLCSVVYVLLFFKNGAGSAVCMLQVIYACWLLEKDPIMLMSVCVVVLTLRIEKNSILEGVFARHCVLKLQGVKFGKHHTFIHWLQGWKE